MATFLPGIQLNEQLYLKIVRPILEREFPELVYSCGLVGYGSDVMGFDTEMSMDHMWGPRLVFFLQASEIQLQERLLGVFRNQLPVSFMGHSLHYGPPDEIGVRLPQTISQGPVDPLFFFFTPRQFFEAELGIDPDLEFTPADWLSFPEQRLIAVTSGKLYHDGLNVEAYRKKLSYYPREVWYYLLAAEWKKISQEEAFVGRTGIVGDEIGSRVITGRLVHTVMRLCFLMEKVYPPYSKWFGSGFLRLKAAQEIGSTLEAICKAETWQEREKFLCSAYEYLAQRHQALGLTEELETNVSQFYGRPFRVIHAERFSEALMKQISDLRVKALPTDVGSLDQFVQTTDVLSNPALCRKLKTIYDQEE